jgi:SAM-dependent methyltransferase
MAGKWDRITFSVWAAPRQTMRPGMYEPQKDLKMALFSYLHSYTASRAPWLGRPTRECRQTASFGSWSADSAMIGGRLLIACLDRMRNPITRPITQSIRESYDQLADEYARRIFGELEHKPIDRDLLNRFAAEIPAGGEVCDMGCGPGQVARHLRDAGAAVFGLDLSPRMLEQARRLNPDIRFREGNMMNLDLQDESLAGVVAFYAIVNIPAASLGSVFREMERVLRPGGVLLLALHIGEGSIREDELWGRKISMDFFLFQPRIVRRYLEAAGFAIEEIIERAPYPPEVEHQSRRAYLFARKPGSRAHP